MIRALSVPLLNRAATAGEGGLAASVADGKQPAFKSQRFGIVFRAEKRAGAQGNGFGGMGLRRLELPTYRFSGSHHLTPINASFTG